MAELELKNNDGTCLSIEDEIFRYGRRLDGLLVSISESDGFDGYGSILLSNLDDIKKLHTFIGNYIKNTEENENV